MAQGKAEDAGGLTPAKDDNTALCHFDHRTLPIFKCVDYISLPRCADDEGGLKGPAQQRRSLQEVGVDSHQQASHGIYRCIACRRYQLLILNHYSIEL